MSLLHTCPQLNETFSVSVENLTVSLPDQDILQDVSIQVNPGDFIGIVGQSGSGKTTLGNIMLGLCYRDAKVEEGAVKYGDINIWGEGVTDNDRTYLRRKYIAYVPQESRLIGDMTVEENLSLVAGMNGQKLKHGVTGMWLEELGVKDKFKTKACHLSGGEQQRVSMVRALSRDTNMLLFDEPTSALSPELKQSANEILTKVHKSGKMVVVITHERTSAEKQIILQNGRILPHSSQG